MRWDRAARLPGRARLDGGAQTMSSAGSTPKRSRFTALGSRTSFPVPARSQQVWRGARPRGRGRSKEEGRPPNDGLPPEDGLPPKEGLSPKEGCPEKVACRRGRAGHQKAGLTSQTTAYGQSSGLSPLRSAKRTPAAPPDPGPGAKTWACPQTRLVSKVSCRRRVFRRRGGVAKSRLAVGRLRAAWSVGGIGAAWHPPRRASPGRGDLSGRQATPVVCRAPSRLPGRIP